ncbi:MAG TPA: TIGR01459 family HAD-type hydrolase [Beijerinckiaceae bacterium]|nr:TIGR01459 family HAD-type hydrolase [Beijerinckiaceae bacterium]
MPSAPASKESAAPPGVALISGLAALAPVYDVVLCDVWGVVHNGRQHFAPACAALSRFRAGGGTVILITNAPRPQPPILAQLSTLGVPAAAFDALVTSGDVTLAFIAERRAAPLYHIGPKRDLALFESLRAAGNTPPPLVDLSRADYVVCTGLFHDDRETPQDYDSTLDEMLRRDLVLISANPDLVVHVGERLIYCAGALAERYAERGGRVLQAGKPYAPIYDRALAMAQSIRGRAVERARVLAIGDAMRTDIKGACDQGLDALFVTSGIHRDELHRLAEPLDQAAFAQFLVGADCRPRAAIPALVW